MSGSVGWQPVLPDLEVFRDSCNVYAVTTGGGTVFVNAGTGAWLDSIPARFRPPFALLCTHYFRDHSAGAARASRMGIATFVPEGEVPVFTDPVGHFRSLPDYIVYDNIWETFAPIEPADVRPARDYESLTINGLAVTVMPLPGVTPNHCGFVLVTPTSGRRVAFCGEAIHSPGRLARVAPLQYDYNDLGGAVNAYYSAGELRRAGPDLLLPSLGAPITADIDRALAGLQDSLRALSAGRPAERALIDAVEDDRLEKVTDHVYMSAHSEAISWYLISESGKALVIDYGYFGAFGPRLAAVGGKPWHWPAHATRSRRRALIHGVLPLQRQLGIERIDVALISHFHDDHLAGVPMLQRTMATECWAPENFADLLERPDAHNFPCDWPYPIQVDRRLPLDRPFHWEEFTFRLAPMSGHTRFSAAIAFEADGKRFAHTGDQFFLAGAPGTGADGWRGATMQQNHVFRNGAFLGSYRETADLMRDWRPDIVLSGHRAPMHTDDAFFALLDAWGRRFADIHSAAMVLGEDETHFGLDSRGGWIWPYRLRADEGQPIEVRVTVRNPLPADAKLTVLLVGPKGWKGTSRDVDAGPRAEVECRLSILPAGRCRRQPIAAELRIGERSFGQFAEALVSVGDVF